MAMTDITRLFNFLPCRTPQAWIDKALTEQSILLIDHANCEKKAATTALGLMYRYVAHGELLHKMSRLAREELRHFEKVFSIMQARNVEYKVITASRYVEALRRPARRREPYKLIDTLILGAIIEARSCERFASLAPFLDDELSQFYQSLLRSEARHFEDYLQLAQAYSDVDITSRVELFLDVEKELILSPDDEFRFHSGVPR